jgi:hypothetical protein
MVTRLVGELCSPRVHAGHGPVRFAPAKPQHWVVASFERHTSLHGLPRPHVHNIVLTSLSTGGPAH